jgi:two-component system, NarL family, response regulator LiaR
MPDKLRVLVVDDHPLMRRALCDLIADESDLSVVGEAADGEAAVELAATLHPDLIVLDLLLPRKDGLTVARELTATHPSAHILALTSSSDREMVAAAIEAGVLGYVIKEVQPEELLHALREVGHGREYIPPALAFRLARQPVTPELSTTPLTPREQEVLRLLGHGDSNRDIARQLSISEHTVRAHVFHLLNKLGLENRAQAALYAAKHFPAS